MAGDDSCILPWALPLDPCRFVIFPVHSSLLFLYCRRRGLRQVISAVSRLTSRKSGETSWMSRDKEVGFRFHKSQLVCRCEQATAVDFDKIRICNSHNPVFDGASRLRPPSQDDKQLLNLVTLRAMPRRDHYAGCPSYAPSTSWTEIEPSMTSEPHLHIQSGRPSPSG